MAKSKSFFGLRKGSTKTLTFQVVNGAQVTKDRVAFVKNPRTESQMANRCIMATASAAYRAMREIVDHSFEGYTYGQQNMSQFISQNITLLRNNAAIGATEFGYNQYRDRAFHPGAYKISKGSLTPTLFNYIIDCDSYCYIDNIGLGVLSAGYTVDDIANALGLAIGEMTTICLIFGSDNDGWNFGYVRIKRIGMGNVPVTTQQEFDAGFEVSSNLGAVTFVNGEFSFTLELRDTDTSDGTWIFYSGVIYSRHTTQGWLRSTAYIEVPDGDELTPDYDTALATYPQGSNYILNGGTVSGGGKSPTPTPIAPEGDAQIFADAACTQYADDQLDPVYVRFNTAIDRNSELNNDDDSVILTTHSGEFGIALEYSDQVFTTEEGYNVQYPIESGTVLKLVNNDGGADFSGTSCVLNL